MWVISCMKNWGERKRAAWWVPRLLTPDNKRKRDSVWRCLAWIHWYTIKTKEQLKQWTSPGEPEEGEACPISRKGDGHRFLGFRRCDLYRLPGEGNNGHRTLLCLIIGPIQRQLQRNRLAKKKVLLHHGNMPKRHSPFRIWVECILFSYQNT